MHPMTNDFIPIARLNHAVLYVSDLERSAAFYREAFGFEEVARSGPMAFLRAHGSENHHDLGLLALGPAAQRPPRGSTGLYHLAWQVPKIEDLVAAQARLAQLSALTGQSDHGATKSLYGADPDGNEFEVMWMLPREQWGEYENAAPIAPLNLQQEVARFGSSSQGVQ
ncbi:MAG TPA: VOC family protein [Dehalococcoidia bacterium]|nr:VOC family protein [Dehalococcoidia bacterium]